MKIQKKPKISRTVLIVVLVVVLILAGGITYWYLDTNDFFGRSDKDTKQQDDPDQDDETTDLTNDDDVNDDIDDEKKGGNEEKPPALIDDNGKKIAQIRIVDASQYGDVFEVRAGMNNIMEENGQCSYTFTRNGQTLSRSSEAIFTGTGTDCKTIDIPVSDFPAKGEWQMVVKYSSATSAGTADTRTISIK
ncbi:hypothetical protein FWH58_03310 [Candidatus Saccharibacteria bacterium]|nr:hypothetical protein [Candidatus Saccharibacteria bacterium]